MTKGNLSRFRATIINFFKLFVALIFCANNAQAHLMPVQEGTVKINGNEVLVTLSIPVSSLKSLGNISQSLISRDELEQARQAVNSEIRQRLTFSAGTRKFEIIFFNLMLSPLNNDNSGEADQLIIYEKLRFSGPENVEHLVMKCDLFGTHETEKSFSIKASKQEFPKSELETESAVFDALNTEREFFKPLFSLFVDYSSLGIEHILSGFDHLLFILTVLVAGSGIRYWVSVVTVFSLAHSITLALTLFAVLNVSPALVEPSIAASIVIMAIGNMSFIKKLNYKYVYSIIFICGLLHGMGFASAINIDGFSVGTKIITLVGFNLGIEFGQLIFLLSVVALITVIKKAFSKTSDLYIKWLVSIVASLCGGALLVQRIMFFK